MEYQLKRSRRNKKIHLRVNEGVVCVSAPFYVSKSVIDDFVLANKEWIQNQLALNQLVLENESIYLLQKRFTVHYWNEDFWRFYKDSIYLCANKYVVQNFLKEYLKKYVDQRFQFFCERIHVENFHLKYGFYKSKWGSCTPSKKQICVNVNLIFMPLEFIDAILLHELAHIFYLNHSADFYNLLCTWMPSYKAILNRNKKANIPRLYQG